MQHSFVAPHDDRKPPVGVDIVEVPGEGVISTLNILNNRNEP
jgi:hypothetical protein